MRLVRTIVLLLVPLIPVLSCTKEKVDESPASAASAPLPAPQASASASGEGKGDDAVRSVYPLDGGTPDPIVSKLCTALHEMPEQRRASCCKKSPGIVFTTECTRMLSGALQFKAVTLDAVEVDRCVAALEHVYEGCDWVGPWPPATPAECEGIVHGVLPSGARCRSSLECNSGLRCLGSGPTTPGRCGPPHRDNDSCGTAVDPLVAFTKQEHADLAHPECTGYCDHLRCAALLPTGTACRSSTQCEAKGCAAGKCTPRVVGKVGEPCPTGECEGSARCVGGTCVARKTAGMACKNDVECAGGCVKSDAGTKVCAQRCDVR